MESGDVLFSAVARPAEEVTICTVSGSGTTLSDGFLRLGQNAALVFDDTCANVTLSNVVVKGMPLLNERPVCIDPSMCGGASQHSRIVQVELSLIHI